MRRTVSLLAALALLLCCVPALAYHFPPNLGTVTDEYGALTTRVTDDLNEYADRLSSADGIDLHVAAVLFLDGLEPEEYAGQLFAEWGLGKKDLLLVLATGEDRFGLCQGADVDTALGSAPRNLLYTAGVSAFMESRDYDGALNAYFAAFNNLKGLSGAVALNGLFETQTLPEDRPSATALPDSFFQKPQASHKDDEVDEETFRRRESRLTWIGIIILLVIIISQSDPVRKARHNRMYPWRSYGFGCSPLGWILGLFGFTALIDRIMRNRDGE